MLVSEQKPFEEILGYLDGQNSIYILACNGCSNTSGTAGPPQIQAMRENLEGTGRKISGVMQEDLLCDKTLAKSRLQMVKDAVAASDAVVVMSCGIGVQASAASIAKPCYPACNTVSLGGRPGEWLGTERCGECGDCLLAWTGGICPVTMCAKSLVNGQCGGSKNGKCEFQPSVRDCGWLLIYERLKALGRTDLLKKPLPPKRHSAAIPSEELRKSELWARDEKMGSEAP